MATAAEGVAGPDDGLTFPMALDLLENEWRRFNRERALWDVEKAKLTAKIARLEGEKKGIENSRHDLVRRVKMLEYALKQERMKSFENRPDEHSESIRKIDDDTDSREATNKTNTDDDSDRMKKFKSLTLRLPQRPAMTSPHSAHSLTSRSPGTRKILQQYLMELGCTEDDIVSGNKPLPPFSAPRQANQQLNAPSAGENKDFVIPRNLTSVARSTDFDVVRANSDSDLNRTSLNESVLSAATSRKGTRGTKNMKRLTKAEIDEFKSLVGPASGKGSAEFLSNLETKGSFTGKLENARRSASSGLDKLEAMVVEDRETNNSSPDFNNKLWQTRHTLRSHFDGVRSAVFHADSLALFTGSEDCTVKFWNLKMLHSKKHEDKVVQDIEPFYTYRGHTKPVLSVAHNTEKGVVASAGADSIIRLWAVPDLKLEPYSPSDVTDSLRLRTFEGHTDAVWDVKIHPFDQVLLSASADGTVRSWNLHREEPLLHIFSKSDSGNDFVPTSVDVVHNNLKHFVVSYQSSDVVLWDIEAEREVTHFGKKAIDGPASHHQPNKIVCHPTLPMAFSAHEDKIIKIYDLRTGSVTDEILAHAEGVAAVAVDPSGLYLATGGHDSSLRFWDIGQRTCVQELTVHRKKYDESILCVAYHSTLPIVASTGADSVVKLYQ